MGGGVEGIWCDAAVHVYSMSPLQSESIHLTRSFSVGIRYRHASDIMLRSSNIEFESERVIGHGDLAASLGRADEPAAHAEIGKPTSA
jgi:hypothetical protein